MVWEPAPTPACEFDYALRRQLLALLWCTPLIPTLLRQKQLDLQVQDQRGIQSEFQDSHSYNKN